MHTVTVEQITKTLRKLPREKLIVVNDIVTFLFKPDVDELLRESSMNADEIRLASEAALRHDWDRPEEDSAWTTL